MTTLKYRDIVIGLLIILFAVVALLLSRQIGDAAAFFPRNISLLLLVFGIIYTIQQIPFKLIRNPSARKSDTEKTLSIRKILSGNIADIILVIITICCLGFILLLPIIGFEASAFCLMFIIMFSMGKRKAISKIYLPVIVPIILNLIFKFVLHIHLPGTFELLFK
jgi:hypothetical protein